MGCGSSSSTAVDQEPIPASPIPTSKRKGQSSRVSATSIEPAASTSQLDTNFQPRRESETAETARQSIGSQTDVSAATYEPHERLIFQLDEHYYVTCTTASVSTPARGDNSVTGGDAARTNAEISSPRTDLPPRSPSAAAIRRPTPLDSNTSFVALASARRLQTSWSQDRLEATMDLRPSDELAQIANDLSLRSATFRPHPQSRSQLASSAVAVDDDAGPRAGADDESRSSRRQNSARSVKFVDAPLWPAEIENPLGAATSADDDDEDNDTVDGRPRQRRQPASTSAASSPGLRSAPYTNSSSQEVSRYARRPPPSSPGVSQPATPVNLRGVQRSSSQSVRPLSERFSHSSSSSVVGLGHAVLPIDEGSPLRASTGSSTAGLLARTASIDRGGVMSPVGPVGFGQSSVNNNNTSTMSPSNRPPSASGASALAFTGVIVRRTSSNTTYLPSCGERSATTRIDSFNASRLSERSTRKPEGAETARTSP